MLTMSHLSRRFAAVTTALALSLVLFANTLAVPSQAHAASAYVGAIA